MGKKSFQRAAKLTHVVMAPKDKIATFWTTKFRYYIISKIDEHNSILRVGTIDCSKPTIITPNTFLHTFEGFTTEDIEFAEYISGEDIAKIRVLGYQFQNKLEKKRKVATPHKTLIQNIKRKEEKSLNNTAIIAAPDDIWSLSITKFAMDAVFKSFPENIRDLEERGFFLSEAERQRKEIEILFSDAEEEKSRETINELGETLQRYNMFEEYEERFFKLVDSS